MPNRRKPKATVHDAVSYRKLADAAEFAHRLPTLRASLKEASRAEGVPASTVLAQLRVKLGLNK